ncbi:MAG TPA: hypothetical protein PKC96_04285 [Bacilli bacterium]|nr:hypothetical protein [Bacilli bacterium]
MSNVNIANMKKALKSLLISVLAILSGVSVSYADFAFTGTGSTSNFGEIDSSIPEWDTIEVVSVAAGYAHSLAVTSLGKVFSWGYNYFGQIGNGSSGSSNVVSPQDITANFTGLATNETVVGFAVGDFHSLAVTSLGKVFAWGRDNNGQLGNGSGSSSDVTSPQDITANFAGLTTNETVVGVSAGSMHSLAVTSLGKVFAWGQDSSEQLGNGSGSSSITSPQDITANFTGLTTNETVVSVSAGAMHSLAVTSLGKVFAWGGDNNGQTGNGSESSSNVVSPEDITANFAGLTTNETVVGVSAGSYHSFAVTSLGKVFAWGSDSFGQLGNGSGSSVTSPENITANFALQ